MAVGTQGAVKAVTQRDLEDLGAEIILANTYHLYLRPGSDRVGRFGGLHKFIGWSRPILTDSGGYQVFSLAARRTIAEKGATFRSHLDGSEHVLTPETAVDIQAQLGSDIAMVLDECLEYPASDARARESLDRTVRWARRAREYFLSRPRRGAGTRTRAFIYESRSGAVRDHSGRDLTRSAHPQRRGDGRHRLRCLRHRRTERRRADPADV